jgi:hypothetical protein
MSRKLAYLAVGGLAVYLLGASGVQADRVGAPTTVEADQPIVALVSAGRMKDMHLVDAYATNAADLRSYQVTVATSGGRRGSLELAGAVINRQRADYVFAGEDVVVAESTISGLVAAVSSHGGVEVNDWAYLGTFMFRPTKDASGEFQVSIKTQNSSSLLADSKNEPVKFVAGAHATIQVGTRPSVRTNAKGNSD